MTAIDVVLVAFRNEEEIEGAVRNALRLGGQVVVVDNGDGVGARRAAEAGATALEDPTNPGFGTSQNRGVAATTTPYVLLANPDADIAPEPVAAGAALLDANPDVAAVQGVIVNDATGLPERSAGVELGPLHLLGRAVGARGLLRFGGGRALARRVPALRDHVERVPGGPVEVESLAATAMLVRRAAFEAVGGFDESYFLYSEDLDLCRRLRTAGWKLLAVPRVWATHTSGGSSSSSWDREVSWWDGTLQFAARWWGPGAWNVAVIAAVIRWGRLAARHPSRARSSLGAVVLQAFRHRQRAGTRVPVAASR